MLRAFLVGMSALALAAICAATMARAETLQVRPNNPGRGDTVTIAPASGAGSGAAPASAPSNPYATSPYSRPPSWQTVVARPPPDYRANAAQLGVSQATLDFLIAQVKARILADPNYITEEPPSVGPAGLPNYPPNEYPPYWYNGGVPPSGDQLEADANYLVERALGTGLNSPGSRPTARLSEVLKQLSDPQYPPGSFTDNPNYKPPVPSEQAGSDDFGLDSTANNEGANSGNGDSGATRTGSSNNQANSSNGTVDPNAGKPSAFINTRDQGVLAFGIGLETCLLAQNPLGDCVAGAGKSGGIAAVCQAGQELGLSAGLGGVPGALPTVSLLCQSIGSYKTCVLSGKKDSECMGDSQGSLPPALFCAALGLMAIEATPFVAASVNGACGVLVGGAWEVLRAQLNALDKEQRQELMQPVWNAVRDWQLRCGAETGASARVPRAN